MIQKPYKKLTNTQKTLKMAKENNFGDKRNSNGFDKRPEDATKGGRKPSIRKQLAELIRSDGVYVIPSSQVVKINDDGSVEVNIPTSDQLSLKLIEWTNSSKGSDSLKALQMIIEQIDGKPKQEIEQTIIEEKPFIFEIIDGRKNQNQNKRLKNGQNSVIQK